MNKQEVIEKIKNMATLKIRDTTVHQQFDTIDKRKALDIISQIHEPKKPVVPKFVADWYEENKDDFEYSLYKICIDFSEQKLRTDLHCWFGENVNNPIETLVKMKLYGYEVEKEKLYTVEIPNPISDGYTKVYLGRNEDNKVGLCILGYYSATEFADNWKQLDSAKLTESEIKQDFEWAFRWAKEVEE